MDIAYACFVAVPFAMLLTGATHAQTPALDQARALLTQRQFAQAEAQLRRQGEGPIRDTLLAQALMGQRDRSDNVAQALVLLQRAAAAGYPEATYPLATIYASSGQASEARQLLNPLAANKEPRALYLLGRIEESVRDYTRAARYYEVAAFAGNADALNNLGFLHANGQGVVRDDGRAASYYREAIAAGSIEAAINLVLLADAGRAVLGPNESRAQLLERGAQAGQSTALRLLGRAVPQAPSAPIASAAPATPATPSPPLAAPPRASLAQPAPASSGTTAPAALTAPSLASRAAATATAPVTAQTAAQTSAPSPAPPAQPVSPAPAPAASATAALPQAAIAAPAAPLAPPKPAPPPVDAPALFAQAVSLQRGDAGVRDLAKAAVLLEQAADAGFADAQRALADVYEYGLGVASNPRKALELRKAAAGR